MGEFISEMQERLLPEYEQLLHYQVCTPEQVRECVRTRERLQLKLTQSNINVSDYLNFIVYEKQMYQMIVEKEKLGGLKLNNLKNAIAVRIVRLYREVVAKFSHDECLWNSFIKFAKKSIPHEVASIYDKMISFHGDKPKVWTNAALWLYEYNRLNVSRVREILLRGLQRHPNSDLLYICFFNLMLKEAAALEGKCNLYENTNSEQEIALERVNAIYRNSLKNMTQLDYFLKLLDSCMEYSELTAKLQRQIIDDMQEKFAREPLLWHALAQRELRGYNLADLRNLEKILKEHAEQRKANENIANAAADDADDGEPCKKVHVQSSPSIWQQRTLKRRIELCVSVYKTAMQVLPIPEMCREYIDAMIDLNKDITTARSFKQLCLLEALQLGHQSKLMHIDHYILLHSILVNNGESGCAEAIRLLTEALEHKPYLRLYELLLLTHIKNKNESRIKDIFNQACKELGTEALPLWQHVIAFYRLRNDAPSRKRLDELYAQACQEKSLSFATLRCDYLSYLWHEFSPVEARAAYQKLALQPPMSMDLHRQMAKLEASLLAPDMKSWRMCFEYLVSYFGKNEPDAWLDYIAFERNHGDAKNIVLLSQRALSTLQPQFVAVFEAERSLFHLGANFSR